MVKVTNVAHKLSLFNRFQVTEFNATHVVHHPVSTSKQLQYVAMQPHSYHMAENIGGS